MNIENTRTLKIDIRSLGYDASSAAKGRYIGSTSDFDGIDYQYMFESSYDAVVITDRAGNILAYNERALNFFEYSSVGSFSDMTIHSLIAGVTDSLIKNISAVIQERRYMRIQAFAITLQETFIPVEMIVMGTKKESDESVCYMIRDVQARKQAEQTLLSAFHAMDNTDSGIGIVDLSGKITYANRKLTSMLGAGDESRVVGQNLEIWFDGETIVKPMIEAVMSGGKWTTEKKVAQEGYNRFLQISVVPDINEDDQLLGMVISVIDNTDRRRAETAEYQLERDRAMMESLSETCHAIGQPATVLLTSIELLKASPELDFTSRKEVEDMCYTAVLDLRECLKDMNAARMSVKGPANPSGKSKNANTASPSPLNLSETIELDFG